MWGDCYFPTLLRVQKLTLKKTYKVFPLFSLASHSNPQPNPTFTLTVTLPICPVRALTLTLAPTQTPPLSKPMSHTDPTLEHKEPFSTLVPQNNVHPALYWSQNSFPSRERGIICWGNILALLPITVPFPCLGSGPYFFDRPNRLLPQEIFNSKGGLGIARGGAGLHGKMPKRHGW